MTVLPRSSVANYSIRSPAWWGPTAAPPRWRPIPCPTDIRRTLYEDSAAINGLGGRACGTRARDHVSEALQIRQDRAADTDGQADEQEPPSETRTPGPGHTPRRVGRPPEAADRGGSDIGPP